MSVNNSDLPEVCHPKQLHSGLQSLAEKGLAHKCFHCVGRRHPAEQVGQLLQPSK